MASYYDYSNNKQPNEGNFGGFYDGSGFSQQQQQQPQQQQQQQPGVGIYGGYGGDQWQQPPGGHMNSIYGTQQQPQQQQQNFWNPAAMVSMAAAAGSMNNEAMLGIASTAAGSFLQSGTARMVPGLESSMLTLRDYFAVDNNYVKTKMLKILFPFRSKHWKRMQKNPPQNEYALPIVDENAPDLYLPAMSMVTYVLLCALCYGTAKHFDPEIIPDVTTKCFVTQILEVIAIRFGFGLMQAPVSILDLFSYTGYKYVGLSLNMFVGLLLGHFLGYGHRAYYTTFLWTASAVSYFMLKTMANNIPVVTSAAGPKREVMVVAFAASQFATMWFVSQTKFL